MNNDELIEIINLNQELLKDLTQSDFLQKNLVGMLRNVESIIPEDSRDNFYTNLKSLRLNFENETMLEQEHAGVYSSKKNEIAIDKRMLSIAGKNISRGEIHFDEEILMAIYHELLHMASTTRDDYLSIGGFKNIETADGEFLYGEVLDGMTEGFTEYLTLLAFNKENFETSSTYGRQINSVNHLSMIVGLDTMKKAYFNNVKGMEDIERALQEIDGKSSHTDLYRDIERDYSFPLGEELYSPQTLACIDRKLLQLSNAKMVNMQKNNPNLSQEYVKEYWEKVFKTMNSPENLQLMGEDASKHTGLDEIMALYTQFSTVKGEKGDNQVISREQVTEATQHVKTSEIDNNLAEIKQVIKEEQQPTVKLDSKNVEQEL